MHVLLRPRGGDSDGGYALVDFGDVEPGARHPRRSGGGWPTRCICKDLNLCLDVVLNHTAARDEWAHRPLKAGCAATADYYLTFTDRADVDAYEATLPEVFPEIAPGSFTWSPELDAWVWTTFTATSGTSTTPTPTSSASTATSCSISLADRASTCCASMRSPSPGSGSARRARTSRRCTCWPRRCAPWLGRRRAGRGAARPRRSSPPTELVAYLGPTGCATECQLAYHNQLMVRRLGACRPKATPGWRRRRWPRCPRCREGSAWTTYLRCHDDIGWAIDDGVAASLSISGRAHRAHLAAFYRGDVWRSWARGMAFSTNPLDGDERTCGMSAALCGITAALAEGDEPALDLAIRRLLLGYAIVFGFGGIPLIYMGDEVAALGNDVADAADPRHAADSRWLHRPAMDWVAVARAAVAGTVEQRVCSGMARLIEARTSTPAMSGGGPDLAARGARAVGAGVGAPPPGARALLRGGQRGRRAGVAARGGAVVGRPRGPDRGARCRRRAGRRRAALAPVVRRLVRRRPRCRRATPDGGAPMTGLGGRR